MPKKNQQIEVQAEQITEAIVPASQVQLGSLSVRNPADLVMKATEMADSLAAIIVKQNLFKVINGRKYVMVEGWTTLGAMMGIVPVEEFCRPLSGDDGAAVGFEAKVRLIRAGDGGMVGAASAECTRLEGNWQNRDSYALRSMSITRATGKAYRLSFSWIMKLAGFEPTLAEEMSENAIGSSRTNANAGMASNPKDTHESLTLTPFKGGRIAISGPGLSIVRAEMKEDDKAFFGIKFIDGAFSFEEKLLFKFQDLCKRLGVPVVMVGSAPSSEKKEQKNSTLPKANIPPADTFPDQPETESTDPILFEAKLIEKQDKKPFMNLKWNGGQHSTFDKGLWPILIAAIGKPAMLEVKANGKYSNLVRILRVDGVNFADEQNQGVPNGTTPDDSWVPF